MNDTETFALIKERLEGGRDAELTVTGSSMAPLFRSGATRVTLSPVNGALRRYDIVLYCRKNGAAVLHRYVGKRRGLLCFRGDGEHHTEKDIAPESVCGVALRAVTDRKSVKLRGAGQRFYGAFLGFKYLSGKSLRVLKRGVGSLFRALARVFKGKK